MNDFWAWKGVYVVPYHDANDKSRGHDDEPYRYAPELIHDDKDTCDRLYPMMLLMNNDDNFNTTRDLLELPFEPADEQWDIFQQLWDLAQALPARHSTRRAVCSLQGAVESTTTLPAAVLEDADAHVLVERFGFDDGDGALAGSPKWDEMLPLDKPSTLLYNLTLLQRVAMPVKPWWGADEKGREMRQKFEEKRRKLAGEQLEEMTAFAKARDEAAAAAATADPAGEGKADEAEEADDDSNDSDDGNKTKKNKKGKSKQVEGSETVIGVDLATGIREVKTGHGKPTLEYCISKQLELEE